LCSRLRPDAASGTIRNVVSGRQLVPGVKEPPMGSMSIWHWLIVGLIILILFGGRGRVSDLMGDLAKGIKSFRKGLAEDDGKPLPDQKQSSTNETKTH
jgi:TatA/E family protein of Tat protein translocase